MKDCVEELEGIKKALDRVLYKHDPDSLENEWIGVANDALLKIKEKS